MGILDFLTAKKYKDDKNSPTEEIQYLHLKDELKILNDKRDALPVLAQNSIPGAIS